MIFHITGFLILFALIKTGTCKIRQDCECGIGNQEEIDLRIINGVTAFPHQYPWIVYMKYYGKPFCGGAILNDRYIITAGHCLYDMNPVHMSVVISGHDSEIEDGITVDVQSALLHPNYTRYESYDDNDIGLIKLQKRIKFDWKTNPICLPNPASEYAGANVVIAGWGTTEKGQMSRYLLHNNVRVLTQENCQRSRRIGPKFVSQENLCAYGYETDTCQGDSGSPLVYESTAFKYELIGIVSWGEGCAPKKIPSVYVKVTNYLSWIEANTKDANYCKPY